MYRMVALDLDGTLLMPDGSIPDDTKEALKVISSKGVYLVLATGRMTHTCDIYSDMLGGASILSFNAAVIKKTDGEIIRKELPPEVIKKIALYCHKHNLYTQYYDGDTICMKVACEESVTDLDTTINTYVELGDLSKIDPRPSPKMVIVDYDAELITSVRKEMSEMFPDLTVTQSSDTVLEIMPNGVDKAYGLSIIAKDFNIDRKEIIAIGDSHNDLPMIEFAGMGIAVGNADEVLKNAADLVVSKERSEGVREAILRLFPDYF